MRIAYDTFLQSEITATSAAKSGSRDRYRYICTICKEEVFLADGNINAKHFRHFGRNKNINCEKYFGNYGALNSADYSRKSKTERAEFYFDSRNNKFLVGLSFSKDDIDSYETSDISFEIRVTSTDKPFYSSPINSMFFAPDVQMKFQLDKFSHSYYLSNTLNNIRHKYCVFNQDEGSPTFFKILNSNDKYEAKLVRGGVIYSNVLYFVAFQGKNFYPTKILLPKEIREEKSFEFKTMGRLFIGKVLKITSVTDEVISWIESWGYKLETSEALTILWPPAITKDESTLIHDSRVYLHSSFILQPGNMNQSNKHVTNLGKDVSCLFIDSKVRIYKKNVEISLEAIPQNHLDYDDLQIDEIYNNNFKVPSDSNTYFLINKSGVAQLNDGMSVNLTSSCIIKRFTSSYLNARVLMPQRVKLQGMRLLLDLLAHYKRTESMSLDEFDLNTLSETAANYIKNCNEIGRINSAAKYFINEGWL